MRFALGIVALLLSPVAVADGLLPSFVISGGNHDGLTGGGAIVYTDNLLLANGTDSLWLSDGASLLLITS